MSNRLLFTTVARASPGHRLGWPPLLSRAWLRAAWRRYRSRQRIADLDAHLLKDIGVSYAEAEAEANRPFWRA